MATPTSHRTRHLSREETLSPALPDTPPTTPIKASRKRNSDIIVSSLIRRLSNGFQMAPKDPLEILFDRMFEETTPPQKCTGLGISKKNNDKMDEVGYDAKLKEIRKAKELLIALNGIDLQKLSFDKKIQYQVMYWILTTTIEKEKFILHEHPITPSCKGVLFNITQTLLVDHPLENSQDEENYKKRLLQIPRQLLQTQQFMERQRDAGIILPKFVLETILKSVHSFIECPPSEHPFFQKTPFCYANGLRGGLPCLPKIGSLFKILDQQIRG